MKPVLLILLSLVVSTCFAQHESSFRVLKPRRIDLGIKADTLVQFEKYSFRIYGIIAAKDISKTEFPGGNVTFNDSFIIINPQLPAKLTGLHIYTKEHGEVYHKQFVIIAAASAPNAKLGPTGNQVMKTINDIAWPINFATSQNDTITRVDLEKKVNKCLVLLTPLFNVGYNSGRAINSSFKLVIKSKGKTETFPVEGLQLSNLLIQKLKEVKPGELVTIDDVRFQCNGSRPDATVLGPYKFLIKE